MAVPPTPLHTARVLQEDKDHWDEVKVSQSWFRFFEVKSDKRLDGLASLHMLISLEIIAILIQPC